MEINRRWNDDDNDDDDRASTVDMSSEHIRELTDISETKMKIDARASRTAYIFA